MISFRATYRSWYIPYILFSFPSSGQQLSFIDPSVLVSSLDAEYSSVAVSCRDLNSIQQCHSLFSTITNAQTQESLEAATLGSLQDMADSKIPMTVENVKLWEETAQARRDQLGIPTSSVELDFGILGVLQRLTEEQTRCMDEAIGD